MVQHVVETPFPAIPLGFFFSREIWDPSLTNMVKSSIRIYPAWKRDTAANGTQICWLITAGSGYGRHQRIQDTKDNKTSL
jgi:hypothetical protein